MKSNSCPELWEGRPPSGTAPLLREQGWSDPGAIRAGNKEDGRMEIGLATAHPGPGVHPELLADAHG